MTDQTDFHDFDPDALPTEQQTITVAHVDEPHDLYGGRHTHGRHMQSTLPPTKGWLGNPYRVSDHGREECIDKYEAAFENRLRDSKAFANACIALPGQVVACHCRKTTADEPACHLDVVREALVDGRVFGFALHGHDISLADWKVELAAAPEALL